MLPGVISKVTTPAQVLVTAALVLCCLVCPAQCCTGSVLPGPPRHGRFHRRRHHHHRQQQQQQQYQQQQRTRGVTFRRGDLAGELRRWGAYGTGVVPIDRQNCVVV